MVNMEDLLEDIKVRAELEHGKGVDFCCDMTTIMEDEIAKLQTGGLRRKPRRAR